MGNTPSFSSYVVLYQTSKLPIVLQVILLRLSQMSSTRSTLWSVTINNPIQADRENIALALQRGWKVTGQPERGAEGTPHYQLAVKTPQVRFSQVKKAFPRAHIEVAKNPGALLAYVVKSETREGSLPVQQEFYPSLTKFWDLIYDHITEESGGPAEDADEKFFSLRHFDNIVRNLICDGYHIETMAVNPQVRGSWQRFGRAFMFRSMRDRQTDRQADLFSQVLTTDANSQAHASLSQEAVTPSWSGSTQGWQAVLEVSRN